MGGGANWILRLGGAAAAGTPSLALLAVGSTKGGGPPIPWVRAVTIKNRTNETNASFILEDFEADDSSTPEAVDPLLVWLLLLLLLRLLLLLLVKTSSISPSLDSVSLQLKITKMKTGIVRFL